jgi:SNF2 family DNA or RNA helicase
MASSMQASALVIVPTSLLTNWQKEMARFAPA